VPSILGSRYLDSNGSEFVRSGEQPQTTTMDPEKRTLLQVELEDGAEVNYLFTTLVCDQVELRRTFFEEFARDGVESAAGL
jgi:DNA gyrase/topoisomerase IV subunit B